MAFNQFEKGCTFANTFLSTFLHQAHVCAPENILKLLQRHLWSQNKLFSLNLIFRCAHMCLIKKGGQEGVCKCATLFKLVNGHDCIPDVHIPSFSNISLPAIGSRDLKTNLTMTSSTTVESSTSETTTTTTESK